MQYIWTWAYLYYRTVSTVMCCAYFLIICSVHVTINTIAMRSEESLRFPSRARDDLCVHVTYARRSMPMSSLSNGARCTNAATIATHRMHLLLSRDEFERLAKGDTFLTARCCARTVCTDCNTHTHTHTILTDWCTPLIHLKTWRVFSDRHSLPQAWIALYPFHKIPYTERWTRTWPQDSLFSSLWHQTLKKKKNEGT